jgi:TetR/AcrR family transcriptional regulator, cholesterol catabolism regulator
MNLASQPDQDKRRRGRPPKSIDERDDGNRRQLLLHCAGKLFRRKGFDATTTRDIAAAVGMHSGSPFYHFKTKAALLYAVMEEGMHAAMDSQTGAIRDATALAPGQVLEPIHHLRLLVRTHFDVLLGPGNDFIPVMLYEARALGPRQRMALVKLQSDYEAAWVPVLAALHASGRLQAPVGLSRLLILGALNWSVQWFDKKKSASLDDLTEAAMTLFFPTL